MVGWVILIWKKMETTIKTDNLYKDILFRNGNEPGLQLGARMRGKGIKGAIVDDIKARILPEILSKYPGSFVQALKNSEPISIANALK